MITPIKLRFSNAFIVRGQRAILVDTGSAGEVAAIEAALRAEGLALADLSLILHTHVHADHVGSTADLLQLAPVPTAFHRLDSELMARGENGMLRGVGLRGRIMARVFNHGTFNRFQPDLFVEDGMRLDSFGIAGQIVHTPGHTPGSISLLLDSGEAIVGDLLMGGYLGGAIRPQVPNDHYFSDDFAATKRSLARILGFKLQTLYVGHGGPLAVERVRIRWPERLLLAPEPPVLI